MITRRTIEHVFLAKPHATARGFAALAALLVCAAAAHAQPQPPVHYPYRADQPPGTIALSQLGRGGPLPGYFQPVELYCPEGGHVSLEMEGAFEDSQTSRVRAGMLIGPVYRAKVTNIPKHAGEEVYPTVEVINRLYPPPGHEAKFPIPIHITQEELELALAGHFITRVVYLEDRATALPQREEPKFQRYFEVHPRQDPLLVADELGRPMAILRMGSRVPDASGAMTGHGSPPLIRYELPEDLPEAPPQAAPAAEGGGAAGAPRAAEAPATNDNRGGPGMSSVLTSGAHRQAAPTPAASSEAKPTNLGLPSFTRELFRRRALP
jgi:hypothetical protein